MNIVDRLRSGNVTPADLNEAAAEIQAENDNFLRALAMVAANGRAQIIPTDNLILGPDRTVICLPRKMYDRLVKILDGGAE